ncbi:MAG TPA: TetR/AcrR family transcriptional regulator [Gemmatimonadaceae bacterium]
MVQQRFDNLPPERREQIFAAAASEFAERGYEAASVNRILDRAGLSKGSLYYYFEDKADLFSTLLDRALARMVKAAGGFSLDELTADTYWTRLEQLVRRSSDFLSRHDWAVQLVRAFFRMGGSPDEPRATGRLHRSARRWTEAVIAKGQALGVLRADLPLAFLAEIALALGEAGDRWLVEHWDELSPAERERFVAGEMDLFRRMLTPHAGQPEHGDARRARVRARRAGGSPGIDGSVD